MSLPRHRPERHCSYPEPSTLRRRADDKTHLSGAAPSAADEEPFYRRLVPSDGGPCGLRRRRMAPFDLQRLLQDRTNGNTGGRRPTRADSSSVDAPIIAGPVALAREELSDLAGRVARRLANVDGDRTLEVGQVIPAEGNELGHARSHPKPKRQEHLRSLAPVGVRNGHHGALEQGRAIGEGLLLVRGTRASGPHLQTTAKMEVSVRQQRRGTWRGESGSLIRGGGRRTVTSTRTPAD